MRPRATAPNRPGTPSRGGSDTDRRERAEKLREAERLLNRAADLMDEALRMSGLEQRARGRSAEVRSMASDPGDDGSLRNLALDMERLEDDPGWTQPLVSPKNLFDGKL